MAKAKLRRTDLDKQNTNQAKGNAAYFGRGTIYSPGFERPRADVPSKKNKTGKKLSESSLQKAAQRRMNGPQ